jgi:hypothetical protein
MVTNKFRIQVLIILFFISCQSTIFAQEPVTLLYPNWEKLMQLPDADYRNIVQQVEQSFEVIKNDPSFDPEEFEESYGEFVRWKNFWKSRVGRVGSEFPGFMDGALTINSFSSVGTAGICTSGQNSSSNWTPLGPFSYQYQRLGKIESVAYDNSNNIYYAGSENGGLYKSIDGALTWTNVTDYLRLPALGIKDIAINRINPQNLCIATALYSGYGIGVLYSQDFGVTWNESVFSPAILPSQKIEARKVKYDPINPSNVWVIAKDKVYKSIDGSINFNIVSNLVLPLNASWHPRYLNDLEIKPNNSNIIYAATDDENAFNGGALVYLSQNGGGTWSDITPEENIERIDLCVSTSDPEKVFALYKINKASSIRISEISQDITSTGSQATFPSYMGVTSGSHLDYIEFTNLGTSSFNANGTKLEIWDGSNSQIPVCDYTLTQNISLAAGAIVTIGLGSGTDDMNNRMFFANCSIDHLSSDAVGYILRASSGAIIDVVAVNGFLFPQKTGVVQFQWTGNALNISSTAGAILSNSDNNTSSNWSICSISNLTTFGSQNLNLTPYISQLENIIFRTYDQTNGWSASVSHSGSLSTLSKNSLQFYVSNINSQIMYAGGIRLYRSINGGTNFSTMNGSSNNSTDHVDIRDIEPFLGTNDVLIGNDGGISKTINGGTAGVSPVNLNGVGLRISEFWSVTSPINNKYHLVSGAQHNYLWVYNRPNWTNIVIGGDCYKYYIPQQTII